MMIALSIVFFLAMQLILKNKNIILNDVGVLLEIRFD